MSKQKSNSPRAKIGRRSRNKGNSFERKVAQLFIEAACLSKKDCYRTPLSGGHPYAGESDLQMSKPMRRQLPFVIECKHYKNLRLEQMFVMTKQIKSWHSQVLTAHTKDRYNRFPMIVMRGNGSCIYAAAPVTAWESWDSSGRLLSKAPGMQYWYRKTGWRLVLLTDVLKVIKRRVEA